MSGRRWRILVIVGMMGANAGFAPAAEPPGAASPAAAAATRPAEPTRAQIDAIIEEAGKTPPEWWNTVALNYPKGLDLTWANTGGGWNPQKNLGQYLWDIINPNPGRWREGIKLIHHTLTVNKGNPKALNQSIDALGRMYAGLLQDYARGAFWARKSGRDLLLLANCYWQLGSKPMAVELLRRLGQDNTRHGEVIKLWADMGELDQALRLAEGMARQGRPDVAYLAAGDACRLVGRYPQALAYYQKALGARQGGRDLEMNHKRARASIEAIKVFDALDLSRVPDGTYRASSIGYNGPVQVAVTVKAGRIQAVDVVQHQEKQFYSSITDTTGQIIRKQGVKGVDATSGATITSEATINATAKALAEATGK